MDYEIVYKRSVAKDLKRIPQETVRNILMRIESDLATAPEQLPSLKGIYAGLRRLRVGDYRVIFSIVEQDVIVLRVAHRSSVYRP